MVGSRGKGRDHGQGGQTFSYKIKKFGHVTYSMVIKSTNTVSYTWKLLTE